MNDQGTQDFSHFRESVKKNYTANIDNTILNKNVFQADKNGDTLLHIVAELGTVETAAHLLSLGSDVNAADKKGKTPLVYAIRNSIEMVETLLDHNSILDTKLLRHAIYFGSEETVQLVLQNTMAVSKHGNYCENTENLIKLFLNDEKYLATKKENYPMLIFLAAKICSKNVLQLILEDCRKNLGTNEKRENVSGHPEEFNLQGESGESALHYAVTQQNVDAVRFLLEHRADPNCKSKVKLTPLHYAARLENHEICQLLINFGADVNPNEEGVNNPLHLVSGIGLGNVFRGIDEFTVDVFSHHRGKTIVNLKIMELLLTYGANPNQRGNLGKSILLQACQSERSQVVEMLLKFNADLRVVDHDGNTALHKAVIANVSSTSIVKMLLEKGHEVDVRNNDGNTPLMFMIREREVPYFSIMEYLVYYGSDLSAKNNKNETVLHIAIFHDSRDVILILLELGLDRIIKKKSNQTDRLCSGIDCKHVADTRICKNVITSYIAMKGDNLEDYSISCFDANNMRWKAYSNIYLANMELEKLKARKILKDVGLDYSYYDFLTGDLATVLRIFKNPAMKREVTRFYTSYSEFPYCKILYQHRLRWVCNLERSFDEIVNFFLHSGKVRLTLDVIEIIVSYLSMRDILLFSMVLKDR